MLQARAQKSDSVRERELYSRRPPNPRRPVILNGFKSTTHWLHFFDELKKKYHCRQKSQIQFVSTSHARMIHRHIGVMSSAQHQVGRRATNAREMLLLSAGKLFQEVGYVRASIHRIAAAVNAPKGTFYNYFTSKEDLASSIVERQLAVLYETLLRLPGETAMARLKLHFEAAASGPLSAEISPLQLLATFSAEGPAMPPTLREQIAEGMRGWEKRLAELISVAQAENGMEGRQESEKLASILTCFCQGAVIRRKSDPSTDVPEAFARFLINLLFSKRAS
jgi:TetR/AcrR family transcriptional regulator, transcriptional repressor for nem operon